MIKSFWFEEDSFHIYSYKYRFEYKVGDRWRVVVVGYSYRLGLELYSASHCISASQFKLVANDFMDIKR